MFILSLVHIIMFFFSLVQTNEYRLIKRKSAERCCSCCLRKIGVTVETVKRVTSTPILICPNKRKKAQVS